MLNSDVQSQMAETEIKLSLQQFDDDMLNEIIEIEEEKQRFSKLFEELVACSINPLEEPQNHKNRNTTIHQYRRRSHKIVKKQQERKRNLQSLETFMQKKQQRECQGQCITEESQVQLGEWQGDHQIQVKEHVAIPLFYKRDDQNLMLLNQSNNNVNINDNCIELNNYEINSNKFQMNAYLIYNYTLCKCTTNTKPLS